MRLLKIINRLTRPFRHSFAGSIEPSRLSNSLLDLREEQAVLKLRLIREDLWQALDIEQEKELAEVSEQLESLLNQHFRLSSEGIPVELGSAEMDLVGEGHAVEFRFTPELPDGPLKLQNELLLATFPKQQNILTILRTDSNERYEFDADTRVLEFRK